jgi:hypothetical protein
LGEITEERAADPYRSPEHARHDCCEDGDGRPVEHGVDVVAAANDERLQDDEPDAPRGQRGQEQEQQEPQRELHAGEYAGL